MTNVITITNPVLFDCIGVAGFGLYVINYLLLTFDHLNSRHAAYFALNLVAASCVLVGLMVSFNLASALIQIFWVAISISAIVIRRRGGPSALAQT